MKAYRGKRCIAPLINLGIRWRWVVNLMPRSLYFRAEPQYPLNRWLGGPQSWPGHLEEKTLCPCWNSNPKFTAHSLDIHIIFNDSSKPLAWPPANKHFFFLEVRPLQDTKNIPAIICKLWALFTLQSWYNKGKEVNITAMHGHKCMIQLTDHYFQC